MSRAMQRIVGVVLAIAALGVPSTLATQELGKITFPTSGKADAQPAFIRGVLLLHSFQYELAAAAFKTAQQLDRDFAMAYWGEALTHTHPVWNEQDLVMARAALAHLASTRTDRLQKAPTARERMYLAAVEQLYGDGSKARRDTLYADAVADLVRAYPDDDEAKIFYAVALLGLNQGVRDVPTYMRAGAIAQEVFRRNQDHPGAAHFVIHAFDDPIHAPLGLQAARRYSVIAPDAPHAQHMTTHIFLALGMWDDVARQNEIASGGDHARWMPGHATHWLTYAYLQQGRYRDAQKLLSELSLHAGPVPTASHRGQLANFRARFVLATEQWDGAEARSLSADHDLPGEDGYRYAAFADGFAAARRGDHDLAQRIATSFGATVASLGRSVRVGDPGPKVVPVIMGLELQAELLRQNGARAGAIALLRRAAALEDAMPVEFGPPAVPFPTHEMLGALLLATGNARAAMKEYQRALEVGPGRAAALRGLVEAAQATGEEEIAKRAYAQLAANWHAADTALPPISELRARG